MKTNSRTRFINEVEVKEGAFVARRPFKMERENRRQFVRLEISAPMSLQTIKDIAGNFSPDGNSRVIPGLILNVSVGGVLVEIGEAINEGDIVSMRFTLQEMEPLDNVLGLVKRVDHDSDGILVGIEFITVRYLEDLFTKGEMDLLPDRYGDFDDAVRHVLSRYINRQAVSGGVE